MKYIYLKKGPKQIIPCPAGTSSEAQATSCITCVAGNYCANGLSTPCSTGYFR